MAQIKYGLAISAASGKIGGNVYSRNRAGAYIRNWAKPLNPPSDSQSAQRARLGMASHEYSMLAPGDQDGFDVLAQTVTRINRLGEQYVPTGRQIYVEANNNLLAGDLPMLSAAPPDLHAPQWEQDPVFDFEWETGALSLMDITNLQDPPAGDALNLRVLATPPLPPGRRNAQTLYRSIINDAVGDPFPILSDYTFLFGAGYTDGYNIFLALNLILGSNGMMSATKYFTVKATEAP